MIKIPLSNPDITDLEKEYVLSVLNTPNLSLGPMLERFERAFAEYVGLKYAVALNSGTSGLHLAVKSLDIGPGDSVITTPFSFIASSNCILFEGAIPVFVDIDPHTLNIDPQQIEDCIKKRNSKVPKAILPVHVFGCPCEMDDIREIAERYGMYVIEDACEAIGAEYRGRKAGTFGDVAVFAFYPNKQMTTGEGGMLVTDRKEIYSLCKSLRNQGRGEDGGWLMHERLGYNYRISDINCALGLAQLERIEEILRKREKVAQTYNELLKDVEEVIIPDYPDDFRISWFVYVIRLKEDFNREDRDRILEGLRERGIGCNKYFPPIHLQPFYRGAFGYKEGDFPVTESVSSRTIALPFYNNLTEEQIAYVVETLKKIIAGG